MNRPKPTLMSSYIGYWQLQTTLVLINVEVELWNCFKTFLEHGRIRMCWTMIVKLPKNMLVLVSVFEMQNGSCRHTCFGLNSLLLPSSYSIYFQFGINIVFLIFKEKYVFKGKNAKNTYFIPFPPQLLSAINRFNFDFNSLPFH